MTAFKKYANELLGEGLAEVARHIECDLKGEFFHPMCIFPKQLHEYTKYNQYEVLEDYIYKHSDQDVNHGTYTFTKGQLISLRANEDLMYFMPDRSKLKLIKVEYKY